MVMGSWYGHGAVEVHLCTSSTLTDAVLLLSCTSNFLSGGTVIVGGGPEFIRIIEDLWIIEVWITEDLP